MPRSGRAEMGRRAHELTVQPWQPGFHTRLPVYDLYSAAVPPRVVSRRKLFLCVSESVRPHSIQAAKTRGDTTAWDSKSRDRLLWICLAVTTVAHTLIHTSVNTHLAPVPLFKEELGTSIELVGLIVTFPALVQALLYMPFGMLTDRFEPQLITTGLFSCFPRWADHHPKPECTNTCYRFQRHSHMSIHIPPAYSVISELFGSGRRNLALELHDAGGTLGMATGPISVDLIMYILGEKQLEADLAPLGPFPP